MVWRLMPNMRATAAMDKRSDRAASTWASRSGEVLRGLGTGVKVLSHSLQRQRAVPPRLVPCRMTGSALWQWGQAITWATMPRSIGHQKLRSQDNNRKLDVHKPMQAVARAVALGYLRLDEIQFVRLLP